MSGMLSSALVLKDVEKQQEIVAEDTKEVEMGVPIHVAVDPVAERRYGSLFGVMLGSRLIRGICAG